MIAGALEALASSSQLGCFIGGIAVGIFITVIVLMVIPLALD